MMQGWSSRNFLAAICLIFLCGLFQKASGYEFSMTGIMTWKYASFSQLGSNGFFGPFDIDASGAGADGYGGTIGSAASINGWLGHSSYPCSS
jgi:hypothetical protein